MTGRIDLHSHLLPGVDDGCKTIAESLACAKELVAAGYSHSVCTPHVWPSLPENVPGQIEPKVAALQREMDAAGIPLQLLAGGELNLRPELVDRPLEQIMSYRGAGEYFLFDLWAERIPPFFEPAVEHLRSEGATLILAHPERMRAVQDDPDLADYFDELGLLLQGNLQCLADPLHTRTRQVGEQFLRDGRYFALATDLHGPTSLEVRLAGLRNAIERVGEQETDRLTRVNPAKIVQGDARKTP